MSEPKTISRVSQSAAAMAGRVEILLSAGLLWMLAASVDAGGPELRFERLSLEQGLSQSTVNSIVQDGEGFLWLSTQDGLNRYDGHAFVVFRNDPDDPSSLSNNVVRTLCVDRDGTLWVGTDGGLNRFDGSRDAFTRFRHDPTDDRSLGHDAVFVIHEDRSGTLWLGTDGGGLDRFDRDRGSFTHYRHAPEDPSSLGHDEVHSIFEDSSGLLWVGSDGGLDRFDRDREAFTRYRHDPGDPASLGHNEITVVYEDRSGALWIGTDGGGLDRFDRDRDSFTHYRHDPRDPESLGHDEIRQIYQDHAGTLWVGTDGGGLNRFDPASGTFERSLNRSGNASSLSNNFVRSIYEDRSDVLWIGTDGAGLNKLDRQKNAFAHYRHDPQDPGSLSHNLVFSIYQDRSDNLWIGTWGGLNRFDRESGTFTHYRHDPADPDSLASDEVWPVYEDRSGDLWIGTFGGLDRLDRNRQTFTHYRHDPDIRGSLSHDYVRTIYQDRAGTLWIGTDGGLNRFDFANESFTHYRHQPRDPNSLSHDDVRSICEDRAGVLWLGTAGGGLNGFDREQETFLHYRHQPGDAGSLSNDFVRSIYEDRAGRLWLGTDDGLNKLDPERQSFTRYRTPDGLPNNVVYGILEDDAGFLWGSTNGGLAKLDPRAEVFKNFDVDDGLQSNEFNTGAYYKDREGEFFFGGINGLNAFFPEAIKGNPHPPPVVLTSFKKFNEVVALDRPINRAEEIELSHRDDFFAFEFAALDYRSPEKNRYAYKLEGFDRRWIEAGTKHEATYTNLDPGKYVFRVKGANNDGVWNQEGASIQITIQPPFWGTWWFRSMAALAVVGALLGLHGYLMARNQRLQEEIAARTRAAEREGLIRELEAKNEELERFNYSVSHDLKSPLVTIRGFLGYLRRDAAAGNSERLDHDINRIEAATGRMHRLVEDLLEMSRIGLQANTPEQVPLGEIVREALDLVAGEIRDRGVELQVAPDLPVVFADRARLVEVLQNLLQNAVKYMSGESSPRIEVGARRDGGEDVFYVRDNGVGIEPEYHDKIFGLFERLAVETEGTGVGLALAKRIVESHGGRIWVESKGVGHGSTFCLTLPGD